MFQRYAVYYTPNGRLAEIGAAWLGWDIASGQSVTQPAIPGLDIADLTETPRKYGLHGTIKPPFHLADGKTEDELASAFKDLCKDLAPVMLQRVSLSRIGAFLAITPDGDTAELDNLAALTVKALDDFRAPPSDAELARRRRQPLSSRQEQNLMAWGYPYVMDEFRFHITLTGRIKDEMDQVTQRVKEHFSPCLVAAFAVDSLSLVGEGADGMFRTIDRCSLTGLAH